MWLLTEKYLNQLLETGLLDEAFGPELLSKYGFAKDSFTEEIFTAIQAAAKGFSASKQGQVIRQAGRLVLAEPARLQEVLQLLERLGRIPNADIAVLVKSAKVTDLHHAVDALETKTSKRESQSGFNLETSRPDWTDGRYKVYKAHSEDACIRYGKGYTFCISRRAGGNMYHTYRRDQLAFYFVFDTQLNPAEETYITVVGVKPDGSCEFTHKSNNTQGTTKHYGGSLEKYLASKPGLAAGKGIFGAMPHTDQEKNGYIFYTQVAEGNIEWSTLTDVQKIEYVNLGEPLSDEMYEQAPAEARAAYINRGNLVSNVKAKVSSESERRRAVAMFFRHGAQHYRMMGTYWVWPFVTSELLEHYLKEGGIMNESILRALPAGLQSMAIPYMERLTAEQYATLTVPQRLVYLKRDPFIKEDTLSQMGNEERAQVIRYGSHLSDNWVYTPEEELLLGRRIFGHIFHDPALHQEFNGFSNHSLSTQLRSLSGRWMELAMDYYAAAKKAGTLQEGYREEKDSTFTHDGEEYGLNQVLAQVENQPTTTFRTDELDWVLSFTDIDAQREKKADITAPLLVAISDEGRPTVVDGAHRLAKAEEKDVETLPAHLVSDTVLAKAALTEEEFNALDVEGRRGALAEMLADPQVKTLPDFKVPYLDREQLLRFLQDGGSFSDSQFQRSHIQVRLLYARQLASLGRSLPPAQYEMLSDAEKDGYLEIRAQMKERIPLREALDRWAKLGGARK